MFIHDLVKIHLTREGYLPNYPYHLISDEEMCDAFLPYEYDSTDPYAGYDKCMEAEINYFRDFYSCDFDVLSDAYKLLVSEIAWHLNELKISSDDHYQLPDWIYSYMLGSTLGPTSDIHDLHDMFVLLDTDNLYDEFTEECAQACYAESTQWLKKLPEDARIHRPPTMFGEPHVIKSLRLKALNFIDGQYVE